jgi:cation:H+ antiporter
MPLTDATAFPLWINIVVFAAAGAIVWGAGTRLVGYLGRISQITQIEQAFIGMFVLGLITSLPEVANVLTSSYFGNPALAVNNLLGSASINMLILAIADAAVSRDALTSGVARSVTLLQATLCMLALALVALAVSSGDVLIAGLNIGVWPIVVFLASIGAFWLSAGYTNRSPWTVTEASRAPRAESDGERAAGAVATTLRESVVKTAVAAAVIFVAGYSLAQTGDALAVQTGLGAGMVGFLLIGIATSLPELSTIFAAVRADRREMAIGEILGTNFVNISLILLADIVFTGGPVINELGRFEIISSLLGVMLIGVYLVGLLERRDPALLRMGYDSFAVIVIFAGGVVLLFNTA